VKIFLDSSKVEEAKRWMPIIDGATTNPSILLKDGKTDIYEFATVMDPKPVSIEACGDFIKDARHYSKNVPNAVIKIPLLKPDGGDNLDIIYGLSKEGIKINCTTLMSLAQVILATKAGARYVSLFAGRVEDEGGDSPGMIADCIDFLNGENFPSEGPNDEPLVELIVGSIRTVGNVLDAVSAGVHIITIPPPILEKMLMHRFSLETVREFEKAHEALGR